MGRPRKASVKLPPHVHAVKARGNDYYYFQRFRGTEREEARVKLPGVPLDRDGMPNAEWWRAYRELTGDAQQGPKRGTFSAVILAYKESPEWRELSDRTRSERVRHLAKIEAAWGELPVAGLEARHVLQLRDQHVATPGEANNIVRSLSSLMSWSIPRGWRSHNPCTKIRMLRIGEGYAPWTWEEIEKFREHARAISGGRRQWRFIAVSARPMCSACSGRTSRRGLSPSGRTRPAKSSGFRCTKICGRCWPKFLGSAFMSLQTRAACPGLRMASKHRGATR